MVTHYWRRYVTEDTKLWIQTILFHCHEIKYVIMTFAVMCSMEGIVILWLLSNGTQSFNATSTTMSISPMFKMFGGGMNSMKSEIAPFLARDAIDFVASNGATKVIIDIGVLDGTESARAVQRGFTVFAFEPINEHIDMIVRHFAALDLSNRIRFMNVTHLLMNDLHGDLSKLQKLLTKEYAIKQFPLSDIGDHSRLGFCYLFQAAASDDFKVITMFNSGAGSDMTNTAPGPERGAPSTVVTLPVSSVVHHDVFWFKSDTQGNELSVLRGAVGLFQNYRVYSLTIEFWPIVLQRIYGENGVNDLMVHMEKALGLTTCFLSRTDEFGLLFDRSVTVPEFVVMSLKVAALRDDGDPQTCCGFFDDLTCF